jgi:outer membrane protein OmpA-like peptidoglycan-associated protein
MSAAGISLLSATSFAQNGTNAREGEFTVQNFAPAPGTKNFLGVEGLRMDGAWGFSAGVFFNYAKNPFVVLSCRSQTDCSDKNALNKTDTKVISDMMTWDLLAAVSPVKRLQIGLRLPLSYVSGQGLDINTGQGLPQGIKKFGVGDPTLEGKVRLFGGAQDPYLVGAALDVSFPVGHQFSDQKNGEDFYLGNSSPVTVGIRGIFDGAAGPVQFGLNLRGVFRQSAQLATTKIGPADFRYGVGLGYRVSPIFRVIAEGFGSTQFSAKNGTNTLETDGAIEITPLESRLQIRVGGGAGILQGVGVPNGRAFVSVAYAREVGDQDGDGIPDDKDKCPTIAEDFDGFEDADGCPDPDNDGDKIPDEKDKCKNVPETINGYQDADGCPDELPDRDHDGIGDDQDKCPDAGGPDIIRNPKSPYYGCPDRDHDGVPDHLDKCPDVPEPTDDLFDGSGCPHVRDTDKDGIPDDVDKCPTEPETYNGFQDADGCPDKGSNLVEVTDTGIKILDRIEFATGKDKIEGAKSFQVLDAVYAILNARKDILLVEVGGHTDNAGIADQNRKLSQKRAEAVVKYLVGKGIDASRLTPKGYGPDKPIDDNKNAKGRQKNRRVEFNILKNQAKDPAMQATPPAAPAPAQKK